MKKAIPVEELRYGMYVVELDRPWEGTPFAFQGFPLSNERQLNAPRHYCKQVYIDPERESIDVTLPMLKPGAGGTGEAFAIRGSTEHPMTETLEAELPRADTVRKETAQVLADAFRAARSGEPIDGRRVSEAVARVTDSVIRNPDAMLLVNRMREKGELVLARAGSTSR